MGVSFFFLTQIWHLTKKRKKKQNEEKKYEINGPGQANKKKLCWRNKSREKKRTFRLIPKLLFFFLVTNDNKWPMTTSVSFWDKLDLLARMIVLKKKRNNSLTKCKRSRRRIQPKKKQHCCPQLKKKHLSISFLRQGCFLLN